MGEIKRVVFSCDHTAGALCSALINYTKSLGFETYFIGWDENSPGQPKDYPVWGYRAAVEVSQGKADAAVLICGTGVGISLAANKVRGIRCACVSESASAELTRRHNDANAVAIGARIVGEEAAKAIVKAFLTSPYDGAAPSGARHAARVEMLAKIEMGECL